MLKGLWQQRRQTRDKFWTGHEIINISWIRYYTFNRTPRSKLYSRLFFFKLYSYSRVQNSIFFFSYGAYRKQLIYLKCSVLNKIVTYRSVDVFYSIISIYDNKHSVFPVFLEKVICIQFSSKLTRIYAIQWNYVVVWTCVVIFNSNTSRYDE